MVIFGAGAGPVCIGFAIVLSPPGLSRAILIAVQSYAGDRGLS
jgi:hypothetical protein